jgi:hypothetical protein
MRLNHKFSLNFCAGRFWVLSLCPLLLGFLRGHGEKRRGFLVDGFTAAFRTYHLPFFVLGKGENHFKLFLAVFAEEFVPGHEHLRE